MTRRKLAALAFEHRSAECISLEACCKISKGRALRDLVFPYNQSFKREMEREGMVRPVIPVFDSDGIL